MKVTLITSLIILWILFIFSEITQKQQKSEPKLPPAFTPSLNSKTSCTLDSIPRYIEMCTLECVKKESTLENKSPDVRITSGSCKSVNCSYTNTPEMSDDPQINLLLSYLQTMVASDPIDDLTDTIDVKPTIYRLKNKPNINLRWSYSGKPFPKKTIIIAKRTKYNCYINMSGVIDDNHHRYIFSWGKLSNTALAKEAKQ
jgi:hypothetical protein